VLTLTTEGILDYLSWAKSQEEDPWLQDDLQIAWLTVLWASRGHAHPDVLATQLTLGLAPDKVWPEIVARRRAKLGPLYDQFYPEMASLPPKKPVARQSNEDDSRRVKTGS
jgi:hypothetical protein